MKKLFFGLFTLSYLFLISCSDSQEFSKEYQFEKDSLKSSQYSEEDIKHFRGSHFELLYFFEDIKQNNHELSSNLRSIKSIDEQIEILMGYEGFDYQKLNELSVKFEEDFLKISEQYGEDIATQYLIEFSKNYSSTNETILLNTPCYDEFEIEFAAASAAYATCLVASCAETLGLGCIACSLGYGVAVLVIDEIYEICMGSTYGEFDKETN